MKQIYKTWKHFIKTIIQVCDYCCALFYPNLTYLLSVSGEQLTFPAQYPSGCLLGYVSVQDCLPQEEYRRIYDDGESESPFVFVCSEPKNVPIKFPVKGEHKICKFVCGRIIFRCCFVR